MKLSLESVGYGGYHQKHYMTDTFIYPVYLINYKFFCRKADTNALLD